MSEPLSQILATNCRKSLIGATFTVLTILRTFAISIFHNTAAPAGLTLPPQLCLIELRLQEKLHGQTSTYRHKFSYHANKKTMDVTEEMLTTPIGGYITITSLMKPVQFTKLVVGTTA